MTSRITIAIPSPKQRHSRTGIAVARRDVNLCLASAAWRLQLGGSRRLQPREAAAAKLQPPAAAKLQPPGCRREAKIYIPPCNGNPCARVSLFRAWNGDRDPGCNFLVYGSLCCVCEWSTRGGPGQQANGPWAQVSRPTGPGPRSAGQWVLGPGQQANGPWAQVTEPTGHGLRSAGQRALGRGQEAGVHDGGQVLAARSSPRGPPPHRGQRAAASRRRRSPGAN